MHIQMLLKTVKTVCVCTHMCMRTCMCACFGGFIVGFVFELVGVLEGHFPVVSYSKYYGITLKYPSSYTLLLNADV